MDNQDETVQPRKGRRGPAPTGIGTPIQVRAKEELLGAIDLACRMDPDQPSRPEMIRRILVQHFTSIGYLEADSK